MGDLGTTYDEYLRLVGKRVGDFLLVLIELFSVNVSNRSGGGNHHFRDLETIANDVRKAEKT